MGIQTPPGLIDFSRARADRLLAGEVVPSRERQAANLDHEPSPPHAPEASPVEAPAPRHARSWH